MIDRQRMRSVMAVILATVAGAVIGSAPMESKAQGQAPARRASAKAGYATAHRARPSDDLTFRPTVLVREGTSRGSGTIIASTRGQTLVLTASHVIDGADRPFVEIHRYNLGLEGRNVGGRWPKVVEARVLARDEEADVAVLGVGGLAALPYVARLSEDLDVLPGSGVVVTSIGIDEASELTSWQTTIRGSALLTRTGVSGDDKNDKRRANLFLITDRAPEHGRSGGGLFLPDGRLMGLCVGRIEPHREGDGDDSGDDRAIGLFASGVSIRRVLERLEAPIVSELRTNGIDDVSGPMPQ